MKLSVLMPVWNERATFEEIVRLVQQVPIPKEIIIVDNCSTDGTRELLTSWVEQGRAEWADQSTLESASSARDGVLRVYLQPDNKGKGSSVKRALYLARGEYVIVQDADLEYDPRDWAKMLAIAAKRRGPIAVFGTRLAKGSPSRKKQPRTSFYWGRLGLALFFRLLYGRALSDVATCYKLMPRTLAQDLALQGDGFELDFEIAARLARRGVRLWEVPISYAPRTELEGKKIRAGRDGIRAVWALFKYRFL